MAVCKTCGAQIDHIRSEKTGRLMPVDLKTVTVIVITKPGYGEIVRAFRSHSASCPSYVDRLDFVEKKGGDADAPPALVDGDR